MDGLIILFAISSIIGIAYNVWISTKPGKKWLENL